MENNTVLSSENKEAILKETLNVSLKVLENTADPIVVEEAKKIEAVVNQLSEVANTNWYDNLLNFDQTLIKKYGVFFARLIEIATLVAVTVKVFYLG